jgi:hypothetical protein
MTSTLEKVGSSFSAGYDIGDVQRSVRGLPANVEEYESGQSPLRLCVVARPEERRMMNAGAGFMEERCARALDEHLMQ